MLLPPIILSKITYDLGELCIFSPHLLNLFKELVPLVFELLGRVIINLLFELAIHLV